MVSTAALLGISGVALGLVLTPGPNMIYLVSRSITQGRRAGLISLGGVALGFLVYLAAATAGIAAVFALVPPVYDALKIGGALYLLYLAWNAVKPGGHSAFAPRTDLPADPPRKLFTMGLVTNLLNPKIAVLYVSLLPQFVHVRGEPRLATLLQLMREESRQQRPAREVILTRLLELVLIEALRSTAGTNASPGLVRGLADERVSAALRALHDRPTYPWTVIELAKAAALSRTTFFERFNLTVGVTPMEYLLAWRMAIAKDLLRRNEGRVAEIAERVGYGSASTFTVAFSRHVGQSPAQYARGQAGGLRG